MEKQRKNRVGKILFLFCVVICVGVFGILAGVLVNKKSSEPGKITPVSFEEVKDKLASKETFAVIITSNNCIYCDELYELLDNYLSDHPVEFLDLNINRDTEEEEDEFREQIKEVFPSFVGTPNMFYVKEGEIVSQYDNMNGELNKQFFHNWVKKYNMDKN